MLVNCFSRRSFDRLFWNQTWNGEKRQWHRWINESLQFHGSDRYGRNVWPWSDGEIDARDWTLFDASFWWEIDFQFRTLFVVICFSLPQQFHQMLRNYYLLWTWFIFHFCRRESLRRICMKDIGTVWRSVKYHLWHSEFENPSGLVKSPPSQNIQIFSEGFILDLPVIPKCDHKTVVS